MIVARPLALTPQEQRILEILIEEGGSNRDIARRMYLSEKTIKQHLSNVMRKFGARNRTQLALMFLRMTMHRVPDLDPAVARPGDPGIGVVEAEAGPEADRLGGARGGDRGRVIGPIWVVDVGADPVPDRAFEVTR